VRFLYTQEIGAFDSVTDDWRVNRCAREGNRGPMRATGVNDVVP
jgi:hypothetical protein